MVTIGYIGETISRNSINLLWLAIGCYWTDQVQANRIFSHCLYQEEVAELHL